MNTEAHRTKRNQNQGDVTKELWTDGLENPERLSVSTLTVCICRILLPLKLLCSHRCSHFTDLATHSATRRHTRDRLSDQYAQRNRLSFLLLCLQNTVQALNCAILHGFSECTMPRIYTSLPYSWKHAIFFPLYPRVLKSFSAPG